MNWTKKDTLQTVYSYTDLVGYNNRLVTISSYCTTDQAVSYSFLDDIKPHEYKDVYASKDLYLMPNAFTGSDYCGGMLYRSNYEAFCDDFEKYFDSGLFRKAYGGYNSFGVLIPICISGELASDIENVLQAIESYPVYDEDHYSNMQFEDQSEQYESWVYDDLQREIENDLLVDLDSNEECLSEICRHFEEKNNVYWEDSDSGQYIDVSDIATGITLVDLARFNIKTEIPDIEAFFEEHDFNHELMHALLKANTDWRLINQDTQEKIEYPDFILVQYNEKQLTL